MMMFWIIPAVAFAPLAMANYGAPAADYNPPVSNYNPPPVVVPQPVYVQVQPPASLPNLPASHEFLRRRRDSSEEKDCYRCKNIKTSCASAEGNCKKPKISYLKCDGCTRAIISCPGTSHQTLQTIDGEVLSEGVGIQKFAKCHKKKWAAKDVLGEKIKFKHLVCIELNEKA